MRNRPGYRDVLLHDLGFHSRNKPVESSAQGGKRHFTEEPGFVYWLFRIVPIVVIGLFPILQSRLNLWDGQCFDIILAAAILFLFLFPLRCHFATFTEVDGYGWQQGTAPEPDLIYDHKPKRKGKAGRVIGIVFMSIAVCALLLFSFFVMYVRYLIENDAGNADARFSAKIEYHGGNLVLNDAAGIYHVPAAAITDTGNVLVHLKLSKLPDPALVWLNGRLISCGEHVYVSKHSGAIWDSNYFKQTIAIFPDGLLFNLNGSNVLEVTSGLYHKSWTFKLSTDKKEQGRCLPSLHD